MTAATVLCEARRRGIELVPKGPNLGYDAPPGAMTDDFRAELTARKAELLVILSASPGEPPADRRAAASWWLARYENAGAAAPAEMIEAGEGRPAHRAIPTHPGWPLAGRCDR